MMLRQAQHEELAKAVAFARRVVGLPWRENGYGPEAYDCWGLARACQKEVFCRDLPIIDYPSTIRAIVETIEEHDVRDAWPEMPSPAHGDVVTMTQSKHPHHVGTWLALDGGRVLHATQREGVMCCSLHQLKLEGFRGLRFHRYVPRQAETTNCQAEAPIRQAQGEELS